MPKLDSGEMCAHHMESGTSPGPWPSEPYDATSTLRQLRGRVLGSGSACTPSFLDSGQQSPSTGPHSRLGPLDGWAPRE